MAVKSVAIVGAGVAGLTAALSLARKGISSDIVEQAPELTEVGAGLQISPNASRILERLGVLERIEPCWLEPSRISLVSGQSLKSLASVPSGDFARQRWGAPYGVLHRATLQQVLLSAVRENPLCRLHLGQRIDTADSETIAAITGTLPELIAGADGVWSSARYRVAESPVPAFSGNIAWRFVVPNEQAPSFLAPTSVTAFLGPSTHLVAYPLKEASAFNIVAIAAGANPGKTWHAEATGNQKDMMLRQFSRWHPDIVAMLRQAEAPNFWPLYQSGEGRWHNGRDTVLIGDAAHAMMPFAAQGAVMAIEDAYILAGAVSASQPLSQALETFEAQRRPRIRRVRNRAAFNQFAYHARGPFRIGRDIVLAMRPPQSLAADFDWLYGYRAED